MPPAVLAWLDYSEGDQRRAREIVAMFSQHESRDELGLGRIRDALSDTLFPGTSVLLTRARYLLFVPWLFREGARRGYRGPQLALWVDGQERRLIGALRNGGDLEGLIGRNVGAAVRILPSTIYWPSLRRFGILRHEGTAAQVVGLRQISRPLDDATEFLERSDAVWAPSIPAAPDDFVSLTRCDFALTHDEATWLAERIVDAVPGTLLQFLVAGGYRPRPAPRTPGRIPRPMRRRDAFAPRSTRLAASQSRCTGPRFSTTCSWPNVPKKSVSPSTRAAGTTSRPGLTSGVARLRRATWEAGTWTGCGRWSPSRGGRPPSGRAPS